MYLQGYGTRIQQLLYMRAALHIPRTKTKEQDTAGRDPLDLEAPVTDADEKGREGKKKSLDLVSHEVSHEV